MGSQGLCAPPAPEGVPALQRIPERFKIHGFHLALCLAKRRSAVNGDQTGPRHSRFFYPWNRKREREPNRRKNLLLHKWQSMELKVNIKFQELLDIIRQLPEHQRDQLKKELASEWNHSVDERGNKEFKAFLKKGPTMSDEQFQQFQEHRIAFNRWRIP